MKDVRFDELKKIIGSHGMENTEEPRQKDNIFASLKIDLLLYEVQSILDIVKHELLKKAKKKDKELYDILVKIQTEIGQIKKKYLT